MATVPIYVYTTGGVGTFNPGAGLPVITNKGVLVSDQNTLNAVAARAAASGVTLYYAATGGSNTPTLNPIPVLANAQDGRIESTLLPDMQLAYACDLSALATVIPTGGTAAMIPGVAISVPKSVRPVTIRCSGSVQVTAAGAGLLALQAYEITSGAAVALVGSAITGGFLIGAGSAFPGFPVGEADIGPTTAERQFALGCVMLRDAASALAASIRSSASGTLRAWIEAVAK